jgi:hypothetical protein
MSPYVVEQFRTERYAKLNQTRWDHFLSMGIPIKGQSIFEPGAGIGDQTEWLLSQGAAHVWVNDGREDNVAAIQERFWDKKRVTVLPPTDLESGLIDPAQEIPFVDLIFCYGVYYHIADRPPTFPVLQELSRMGEMIALDYLAGNDNEIDYGYDNPSTSLNRKGFRPRPDTLLQGLTETFGYAYSPKRQLEWTDPLCAETRLIAVGSHFLIDNANLIKFAPVLTPATV